MQALDTLTPALWRGYQRDTFPEGSWVCEEGMLRTVAKAEPMCSGSRTSAALLKNIVPAQLTLLENIAGVLLTFGKNVLRLW